MALDVERIVKAEGATPATIAVMHGRVKVGLSTSELEFLAKVGQKARKTSRRDLALVMSQGEYGATTVSGTMVVAHRAGIKVFVTGGIGGVHRGGESTMDISADLTELGRTPVTVVCAGVKSILDIERTLEYLETHGVTVATYGMSDEFPAFYVPRSGFKSMVNLTTPEACAGLIKSNIDLQLESGTVIAVPIRAQDSVVDPVRLQATISDALMDARKRGIKGKDQTPFLLNRVNQLTRGRSLAANIALVKNNAQVGSRIAVALSEQLSKTTISPANRDKPTSPPPNPNNADEKKPTSPSPQPPFRPQLQPSPTFSNRPFIVGGSVLDITAKWISPTANCSSHPAKASDTDFKGLLSTSSPGTVTQTPGGVGRNIAEACFRTGGNPLLHTVVGDDLAGRGLVGHLEGLGMDTSGVEVAKGQATAVYNALLLPNGNLLGAVADMSLHDRIDGGKVADRIMKERPRILCFDGNITTECMEAILETCRKTESITIFEPTSVPKSQKILSLPHTLYESIKIITPDRHELRAMAKQLLTTYDLKIDDLSDEQILRWVLLRFESVFLKRGGDGVLACGRNESGEAYKAEFRPQKMLRECVSVTGAGDSFVGAVISGLLQNDLKWQGTQAIPAAMRVSEMTLMSKFAVSEEVTPESFRKFLQP
ncbi:hypothetical protein HK097_002605 [Rhizophlyctis rosea]|uniref:Carbohydrate kinase PfkB domain-containing protein n=1 Tax=Rhizophlyctis rosea TaxID=64517 RepID=A0AAD5SAT0_9FUNG|nr:hypothetical protein HK097_002605 [Rhizophlyctis rosea]